MHTDRVQEVLDYLERITEAMERNACKNRLQAVTTATGCTCTAADTQTQSDRNEGGSSRGRTGDNTRRSCTTMTDPAPPRAGELNEPTAAYILTGATAAQ